MFQEPYFRKSSLGGSSSEENEALINTQMLFPRNVPSGPELSQIDKRLPQQFKKDLHLQELSNYCFRCHRPESCSLYNDFRLKFCPQLQQPKISVFYGNECFANLTQIGTQLEKPTPEFPGIHMEPIPTGLRQKLDGLFREFGYIPNLQRFLLAYPSYFEKHIELRKTLFQSGKIDAYLSFFLGLCAAAELGSVYMMSRMITKFQTSGGPISWIKERTLPEKISKILPLNRKLARCIWAVSCYDIQQLLQGNLWNKNQLALCVSIMVYTQQMSTLALAIGLEPEEEVQFLNVQEIKTLKAEYDSKIYPSKKKEKLEQIKKYIKEDNDESKQTIKKKSNNKSPNLKASFRGERTEESEVEQYMTEIGNQLSDQGYYFRLNKLVEPLLPKYEQIEKRREKIYPTLQYSDFNFKFMAYPILYNLNPDTNKILELINCSDIMTRENFGKEKFGNTRELRRAMCYYAQNLCGYTHHEYDYSKNTGLFLTLSLKFYIRLLILSPFHINRQVLSEVGHEEGECQCFDLGHVAILIANTKMSLALTFFVQALQI